MASITPMKLFRVSDYMRLWNNYRATIELSATAEQPTSIRECKLIAKVRESLSFYFNLSFLFSFLLLVPAFSFRCLHFLLSIFFPGKGSGFLGKIIDFSHVNM